MPKLNMKRDKDITCEKVLLDYLTKNPTWHKKSNLYGIAEDWSAETVGRDLRTLAENGKIHVDYYDGKYAKNLAMYSINQKELPKTRKVEIVDLPDGRRVARIIS